MNNIEREFLNRSMEVNQEYIKYLEDIIDECSDIISRLDDLYFKKDDKEKINSVKILLNKPNYTRED